MHLFYLLFAHAATSDNTEPKQEIVYKHKPLWYLISVDNEIIIKPTEDVDFSKETLEKTKKSLEATFDKFTSYYTKKILNLLIIYENNENVADYENQKAEIMKEYRAFMEIYMGAVMYHSMKCISWVVEQHSLYYYETTLEYHIKSVDSFLEVKSVHSLLHSEKSNKFDLKHFLFLCGSKLSVFIALCKSELLSFVSLNGMGTNCAYKDLCRNFDKNSRIRKFNDKHLGIVSSSICDTKTFTTPTGNKYKSDTSYDDFKKVLTEFIQTEYLLYVKDFKDSKLSFQEKFGGKVNLGRHELEDIIKDPRKLINYKDELYCWYLYVSNLHYTLYGFEHFCVNIEKKVVSFFDDVYIKYRREIQDLHTKAENIGMIRDRAAQSVEIVEKLNNDQIADLMILRNLKSHDLLVQLSSDIMQLMCNFKNWADQVIATDDPVNYPYTIACDLSAQGDNPKIQKTPKQTVDSDTINGFFYSVDHIPCRNAIHSKFVKSANILEIIEGAGKSNNNKFEDIIALYMKGGIKICEEINNIKKNNDLVLMNVLNALMEGLDYKNQKEKTFIMDRFKNVYTKITTMLAEKIEQRPLKKGETKSE